MNRSIRWGLLVLLFACILVVGNKLRSFSYATVPHPGETTDEYSYGWLGLSIVKDHKLISWSTLSPYETRSLKRINVDTIFDKDPGRPDFPIVEPWFDHPPFFGLLTGGYAYMKGVRSFEEASVGILRRPMLKLALVTTLLIFVLATRLFGKRVGFMSSLLYSIVPTTVISSRLAMIENGYIPLFLGSLCFAHIFLEKRKMVWWWGAIVLACIGMLFKLSAVAIFLSLILVAFYFGKENKKIMLVSAFTGVGVSLLVFFVIGASIDLPMFMKIFAANRARFYGASSEVVFQAIGQFRLTTYKFFTDGWLLAAWFALIGLITKGWEKSKSVTFLTIAVFSYLAIFIFFGSESYGWYKYPLMPFLIIALAKVLVDLFARPNILVLTILLSLPIGTMVHRLIGVEKFQQYVPLLRLGVVVFIFIFILNKVSPRIGKFLYQGIYLGLLVFAFWLCQKQIYFYTFDTWFGAN